MAAAVVVLFLPLAAQAWEPRTPPVAPPRAHELARPERWPSEPEAPAPIDPARFRAALAHLCGRAPDAVPADELRAAADETKLDPFMLGALMVERSRCDPRAKGPRGEGLLGVQPALYRSPGAPEPPVPRETLTSAALRDPAANLRTGARLLQMWQEAHDDLDTRFESVAHRSGVAHYYWGDRVRGTGNEDLVFTARRRFIAAYQAQDEAPRPTSIGIQLVSPLEGTPRVATSGPGDDRDGGMRRHRGLDIVASEGEPVRAIADGTVIFAGVNLRGAPRRGPIAPSRIARYRHRRLGVGGIYLCIDHDVGDDSGREVRSCYMHLDSYVVAKDERVRAGQVIGYVGRTGVKVSPPHLHLEVRVDDRCKNPLRYLGDLVIPPGATKTHRRVVAAKRARVRAARAANGT
jgi:murein DD-endopeptidase MepM/ murein hydrolase activator NlpD